MIAAGKRLNARRLFGMPCSRSNDSYVAEAVAGPTHLNDRYPIFADLKLPNQIADKVAATLWSQIRCATVPNK